ncbi:hypothetical protein [Herbaspirillum frisingense]|uniref:hypothetical protein n=1 Tax=Herbaspirillum frisingense TaxID=92645 RepID=UPI001F436D3F|nr:hypothetical protein [Herbaspirillum frisingense]UIN22934.1 hypothetical protein LAZ82_07475 [Herbaspirillum frisingense]
MVTFVNTHYFFSFQPCYAGERETNEIELIIKTQKQIGEQASYQNIEIDKVLIKSSEKLGNAQIKRINSELQRLNISFHKSARACYDPQWPGPWGHVLKYEKANFGKNTLSILFDVAEGCSGQPHFNTFAANFSIQTGKRISTKELLERYAPSLLKAGAEVSHDFLILGDDAFSILMEQNEGTFTPDLQESCDFFLRRTGFRVWVEENRLVLLPPFQVQNSICHKRYYLQVERSERHEARP